MNTNTLQGMASDLVGKQVIMTTNQNSDGFIGGTVDYWETINGTVYLGIGGKLYDIADLDTVMDKSYSISGVEKQILIPRLTQTTRLIQTLRQRSNRYDE